MDAMNTINTTTKTKLDATMVGQTAILDGVIEFARLTHFVDGEELKAENERRRKQNKNMPIADRAFCSITIANPQIRRKNPNDPNWAPTPFEKYVCDKCYKRGSDGMSMFNHEIKAIRRQDGSINKILPRVYNSSKGTILQGIVGDTEYRLPGEPVKGTKCSLEFRCVETQHQYPAFILSNITLEEPIDYRSNVPLPEDFRLRGITSVTVDEKAVKAGTAANETATNEQLPLADSPAPFNTGAQPDVYGTQTVQQNNQPPMGAAGIGMPDPSAM